MHKKLLLVVAGLASLPMESRAQTAPISPRFYVGAGASLLTALNSTNNSSFVGPSLAAGIQLNPHVALQLGGALAWKNYESGYSYVDYGQTIPTVSTSKNRNKLFTLPVLLRYTFTPSTTRFHTDALAGITMLHSTFHYAYSSTYNGTVTDAYETDYAQTRASFTLGPAVRYALAPQLELTANALVNAVLGDSYYRFSDRLFFNLSVGAHYTFGQR